MSDRVSFKDFFESIENSATIYEEIKKIISEFDEEDLYFLGSYLLITFFGISEDEVIDLEFSSDDILDIVNDLGEENFEIVYDLITYNADLDNEEDFFMNDVSSEEESSEDYLPDDAIGEKFGKIFLAKNFKRGRSFFAKSKASLAATKAKNRIKYLQNKAKIQRNLRLNKTFLKSYRKSRAAAIKSKKHIVQHHIGLSNIR